MHGAVTVEAGAGDRKCRAIDFQCALQTELENNAIYKNENSNLFARSCRMYSTASTNKKMK